MANKILVLGSTGNIGKYLVEELLKAKNSIRAGVRKRPQDPTAGVEWTDFDFANPSTYAKALDAITSVFLLTPVDPQMVTFTKQFLEAAEDAGVQQIVKVSAMGAGQKGGMTFGDWHSQAEKMIQDSGIAYTFLRPNGFMQNFVNFSAPSIRKQSAFYSPMGNARVSYIDTRDIALVAARVLNRRDWNGKALDLTGPEAISNSEAASILSEVVDRKITYVPVSSDDSEKSMKGTGMPDWYVQALLQLCRFYEEGKGELVTSSVEEVAGQAPRSFDRFATDFRSAFMA